MLKIAVIGSFSAAAALTFAPLAAADDLTSAVGIEVSALNDIFTVETDLAGVPSTDVTTPTSGFDTITTGDIGTVQGAGTPDLTTGAWNLNTGVSPTEFDYLTYGLNPTGAGLVDDPGSYDVFNGALARFADALNAAGAGLETNDGLASAIPSGDLIGGDVSGITSTTTDFGAALDFLQAGLGDLSGFFDLGALIP